MSQSQELRLSFSDHEALRTLLGARDAHLRLLAKEAGVKARARGGEISLNGEPEALELAALALKQLYDLIQQGYPVYEMDVDFAYRILAADPGAKLKDIFLDQVYLTGKNRIISPKTLNQKKYLEAIRAHDIVFGIGPAGTGKTYLAMAMAVDALLKGQVDRIVLARPAVEAGEKLGFLPGDLAEKVNPYLRPLYDALHDMIDFDKAGRLMSKGVIEVAPLAFMRGRTLNSAFVILDEAQNSTSEQMKMFLTRLGFDSKAVITGDVTQVDLPGGVVSGLVRASQILHNIEGIAFVDFDESDVVRHHLVRRIIKAYDQMRNGGA
ncbi:MAG: PhoH family protein [Desulfarculus sp.]|nr:PhoH family protein [Pseudomonadota bacterium]MBV1715507.1 PhoH family protein [Desulfarculus sp.]MBU4574329.1 PhoH family protein [Pseudomonadota bacterium]MBU4596438.1 PhoH family protein [Pseudomonadota bacterium]MBV1740322.1 PhoH family protein [Desulfarculus sp.]